MAIPPYIQDVLTQPGMLREAALKYSMPALEPVLKAIQAGKINRIVITGMGASLTGAYPAWIILSRLPVSVLLVDTSELLHYLSNQIDSQTLLWVISQSGRSAEIQNLLDQLPVQRPWVLGTTNELDSPLGQRSDVALPIYSGAEHTVSTRSYLNTLLVTQTAALQLLGNPVTSLTDEFLHTAEQAEQYLSLWEQHVEELKQQVGLPKKLFLLGRGPSMAAVLTGALILKEAAKVAVEGMTSAQFRHGPLELADEQLTVMIFDGPEKTVELNRSLAKDVARYGGNTIWISDREDPELKTLILPSVPEGGRPIMEILPIQMLSIALAELNGFIPGQFRHLSKVTLTE